MKYNIEINQLVLSKTNLDVIDGSILNFIIFICLSKNQKVEQQRKNGFTWINYEYLLAEMPLLKIKSKGSLSNRLKKIEKEGYIKTIREKHQKIYVELTERIDELFTRMNSPVHENEQLAKKAVHENEQIIIDNNSNNIDNNTTILSGRKPSSEEKEEFVWQIYLKKMLKDKQQHIKIIASFFRIKDIKFSSKKQVQSAISRHSRAAVKLVPFSNKDLRWSATYCKNKWGVADVDWTLDTMLKALTSVNRKTDGNPISQKRKSTKYKDLLIKEVKL